MANKTTQELVAEWLAKGNQIKKLPISEWVDAPKTIPNKFTKAKSLKPGGKLS